MGDKSAISWTDASWNPTIGCTRVSAGCDHCYAFALHDQRHIAWKRGRYPSAPPQYHEPFSKIQVMRERLDLPLRWRKPRRIFVNSMSDLFHEAVPDLFILEVFLVMAMAREHIFQVLTKRPERMQRLLAGNFLPDAGAERGVFGADLWPLPNVWLGVSGEDQHAADERIPPLLETPAAVRFVSAEPLLGPINLRIDLHRHPSEWPETPFPGRERIDWVIVGGESGPRYRPMDHAWTRRIRDDCRDAGVAYFGKQDAGPRAGIKLPGALGDQEFPA